ncbi:hypothetical protein BDEG_27798 [Batrachochytrium dendrobatidis JEL423]|nr:hypothetical protein BDEG_27798 [Batrachochytrium dendrobatidis JEL423]
MLNTLMHRIHCKCVFRQYTASLKLDLQFKSFASITLGMNKTTHNYPLQSTQIRHKSSKSLPKNASKSPFDLVKGVYNPPASMSKRSAERWAKIAPALKSASTASGRLPPALPKRISSRLSKLTPDKKRPTNKKYVPTSIKTNMFEKQFVVNEACHLLTLAKFLGKMTLMNTLKIREKINANLVWVTGSAHAEHVRISPKGILHTGDVVHVAYATKPHGDKTEQNDTEDAIKKLKMRILYKDQHIYVIDKEHGLASQGGSKIDMHLDKLISHLETDKSKTLRLVHRLDKNTSGAMIIARTKESAARVSAMFRQEGRISRKYLALLTPTLLDHSNFKDGGQHKIVSGIVSNGREAPHERMDLVEWHDGIPKQMSTNGDPVKKAVTKVTLLQSNPLTSLVCLEPTTGRKHQLRLHCADALGSFIVGDYKYGQGCLKNFKAHVSDWKKVPLHLHLYQLSIKDWFRDGLDLTVSAPLPIYFQKTLTSTGLGLATIPSIDSSTLSDQKHDLQDEKKHVFNPPRTNDAMDEHAN